MAGLGVVFRRELAAYFTSPVAYVIAAAFLLVTGLVFNSDVTLSLTVKPINPAIVPNALAFFMAFFAPVLTMRLIAEEAREGTLELVLTAPVTEVAVVVGKFLSAWAFFTILLMLTLSYQIVLANRTSPDIGIGIAAYIGIWLYSGAALAVGLMCSALTENQVVAAFLGIASLLLLYLGELAGQIIANLDIAYIVRVVSMPGHYVGSFAAGLIRFEDVVYFAGVIFVALFITIRLVEARRLR